MTNLDEDDEVTDPLSYLSLNFYAWLQHESHKLYDGLHIVAHTLYFAAVYIEGHGLYAMMGGALFIISIWGFLGGYMND